MNDAPLPSGTTPTRSGTTLETLAAEYQSLRTAFNITLFMLLVLSGSLFVFFLREISIARRQMTELTQVVREYEKTAVPLVEDLRTKLQGYARTHPDFTPIYARYFGTNVAQLTPGTGKAQPVTNRDGARLPPNR